jgi:hypothetical protein
VVFQLILSLNDENVDFILHFYNSWNGIMAIIYTGKAAPLDGKRKLTAKESTQRARAMACIRSPNKTVCQGNINVGIFFDGTGNNFDWVQDGYDQSQRIRNKHSNVARLWDVHLEDSQQGYYRIYIPGVGTPFESIGDTLALRYENAGNGFAYMGSERINWGITGLLNSIHRYLTTVDSPFLEGKRRAAVVSEMSAAMLVPTITEGLNRWAMLTKVETHLSLVVKSSRKKLNQINISVFGFSRGAAQARAFVHWLNHIFESESGGFEIAGVPVRINFLGVFDTVAAVGLGDVTPMTAGHTSWGRNTQSIHHSVEDCAHFIALHEQRASFPLESATGRGNVGYPGMHSDVGGGYYPGEQGKAMPGESRPSPHLSQITLIDMHFAALKAGVPLKTIEEINLEPTLRDSYSTDPQLMIDYNNWLENNGIAAGHITEFTEAHAKQYLRWRGTFHFGPSKLAEQQFYLRANEGDKNDLAEADADLGLMLKSWREREQADIGFVGRATSLGRNTIRNALPSSRFFIDKGLDPLSKDEEKFLKIFRDGAAPPVACSVMFSNHVHDSRSGFRILGHHEPLWLTGGYARFRNVFLQSDPDVQIYNSLNESLKATTTRIGETIDFHKKLYERSVNALAAAKAQVRRGAEVVGVETIKAGVAVRDAHVEAGRVVASQAVKTGAQLRKLADEQARLYNAAQKKIILEYVKAHEEWRRQMTERWAGGE